MKNDVQDLRERVIRVEQKTDSAHHRLDVLEGNLPAEKSYVKVGFEYVGTVPMFYEDTGWTNYKAFEYAVELLEYHW